MAGCPVVMVSDTYSVEDELQVMSLGSASYACKPLELLSIRELAAAAERSTSLTHPSSREGQRMVA